MEVLLNIFVVLLSYFFGSISSAIIVCKIAGLPDPRDSGSNNPGATNVLRLGGKKYALLTLFGDVLKGVIPVVLATAWHVSDDVLALVMLAAFFGHLYPVFFGFKGGKGVATAFGVIFGLSWQLGLAVGLVWVLTAAIFRYSSLAGLVAFLSAPFIYHFYFSGNWPVSIALLIIAVFLAWRHRANIARLLAGTEPKIGR